MVITETNCITSRACTRLRRRTAFCYVVPPTQKSAAALGVMVKRGVNVKFGFLKALTCIFAAVSIDAASEDSAAQKYAWECQERTDKMSGRVTKSVTGISNNFVQ